MLVRLLFIARLNGQTMMIDWSAVQDTCSQNNPFLNRPLLLSNSAKRLLRIVKASLAQRGIEGSSWYAKQQTSHIMRGSTLRIGKNNCTISAVFAQIVTPGRD
jgi:hypothetical protein